MSTPTQLEPGAQRPLAERSRAMLAWLAGPMLFVLLFGHTVALRHLLTATMLVGVIVHFAARRRLDIPLAAPVLAWLAYTVASCLWSPAPAASARAWLDEAFYPLLAFCAFHAAGRIDTTRKGIELALCAGLTVLALISTAGFDALIADGVRPGMLHYYPGVGQASTYAVLALPLLLPLVFVASRTVRLQGTLGLVAAGAVGALSLNRMFWPAAVVTVLCALGYRGRWLARYPLTIAAGLVAAIALALALIAVQRGLVKEDAPPTPARMAADLAESFVRDPRPAMWIGWAEHAAERPWTGIGFGKAVPGAYLQSRHPDLPAPGGMIYWDHAHNYFLNTLMQTGAIGLALLLWLFGALAWGFARARYTQPTHAWAGLALVVALLMKNVTDDFMRDAVALCFWALAGYVLARAQAARGVDTPAPTPPVRSARHLRE